MPIIGYLSVLPGLLVLRPSVALRVIFLSLSLCPWAHLIHSLPLLLGKDGIASNNLCFQFLW